MPAAPIFVVIILLIFICLGRLFVRTGKVLGILFSCLFLLNFLFIEFYFIADYFTNEGVNESVFYHMAYGLEGAGFGEYSTLIVVSVVAIIASVLLSLFLGF